MANKPPLTTEERLRIVEALKKGNLSHRAIAKQFNRSQSTISTIAKDAGITPTHRRKRTPAAQDVEGSFTREERINLTDRVLGVIGGLVEDGGLSPRDLRETTQALKQALDARRSEDIEPKGDDRSKEGGIVWDEAFASEDSLGMGYDPNTEIGREMIRFTQKLDEEE
jgi:transposase-like protein